MFLCDWFLLLSIVSSEFIHPNWSMYAYSIFFNCQIFHFVYPVIHWRTLRFFSFLFLAIMNICFQLSWVYIYPGVELLGQRVTLCLSFWETARLLSKVAAAFYSGALALERRSALPGTQHACPRGRETPGWERRLARAGKGNGDPSQTKPWLLWCEWIFDDITKCFPVWGLGEDFSGPGTRRWS